MSSVSREIKSTNEYVSNLRNAFQNTQVGKVFPSSTRAGGDITPGFQTLNRSTQEADKPKEDDNKTRMNKMQSIKGEIQTLLSKLENTSRSIGSSFQLHLSPPAKAEVALPKFSKPTIEQEEKKGELILLARKVEEISKMAEKREQEKHLLENRLEDTGQEKEELEAKYTVEIQNLRLQNMELQQKLRVIEEKTDYEEIFGIYNREIEKLNRKVEELRSDLIRAETEAHSVKNLDSEADVREAAYKKNTTNLRKIIKKLEKDIQTAEKENEELKREKRKYKLQERILADAQKRVNKIKTNKEQADTAINILREQLQEAENLLAEKTKENKELIVQLDAVAAENQGMSEEIKLLKDFAYNVDQSSLQTHYERYVKIPKTNIKHQIWEDLLEKLKKEGGEKIKGICESIQFEGKGISEELARAKENQSELIELLTIIHTSIQVFDIINYPLGKERH